MNLLTTLVTESYKTPNKRKPDFIVIGAQKAATTWLWTQFSKNPSISTLPEKEIHYFDRLLPDTSPISIDPAIRLSDKLWFYKINQNFKENISNERAINWLLHFHFSTWDDTWFERLFGLAPPHTITGEVTPRYAICDIDAIEHMHSIAPNTKLIFCIRNPVERFWSQCLMKYKNQTLLEGESSAMAFFDTPNGKARGLYSETILRFCKKYEPSQILIVFYDAITSTPQKTMKEIHQFLGIPDDYKYEDIEEKINKANRSTPMPLALKARIKSAYKFELNLLKNVFSGYTYDWLEDSASAMQSDHIYKSTLQLTPKHIECIKQSLYLRHKRKKEGFKVFCLSMQRSGTTSVGDWLESHGLIRSGSPTSSRLGWSRHWFNGQLNNMYDDRVFQKSEILEDDPFWFPKIYIELAERFPNAKFILLERDPDSWFASMCRHSNGKNPGWSDIHARVFNREDELYTVLEKTQQAPDSQNLLSITKLKEHYINIYQQHTESVLKYFSNKPGRLLYDNLNNKKSFDNILTFLGLEKDASVSVPQSNKLEYIKK